MGPREPNGRLSRRKAHVLSREAMAAKEARSVVVAARMRMFGLSEARASTQEGGPVIGRMLLREELDDDQAEAAARYLEIRNAYHRAIGAVSDTGRAPPPEEEGEGTYEDFCYRARKRWSAAEGVIRDVMQEQRSPAPASALEHFIVRDMYVPELVGPLREALNALHRHFVRGDRSRRKAA